MLRLSQSHLNLLETCPPKFQQCYLNQRNSLPNPEIEDKQTWGKRFHLLMQQRELGLPIESLLQENKELDRYLKALIQEVPELANHSHKSRREAEYSKTISFNDYILTVIYDLLIAEEHQVKIIDWKTYLKPQNKHKLAQNWQTRLYLYVLAETSDYSPEQISMTYWFVKLPTKPQCHTFFYNHQQHQQTKQDLTNLLKQLDNWLKNYPDLNFPHHPDCDQRKLALCDRNCPYYAEFCTQHGRQFEHHDLLPLLENIPEISI